MQFRISDTFTDSLARLTADEQKAVKTTAFDLQMNPANPGMNFHRLDRAKDKNFWSVRAGSDLRMIVHRSQSSLLLCYVDHHDKAYDWAARRKLETHPATGAAQLVEIRESVRDVVIPRYVESNEAAKAEKPLLAHLSDEELLSFGVPPEWTNDVRNATSDSLLGLADHLPAEAAEALLELATGGKPKAPSKMDATVSPFDHPDAQRRFRGMSNVEELQRALDFPWDKWTIFLHPEQRQWVERDYAGPARVSGSAGTGKTIVALHRAVFLARANPVARVLLTTFSTTLANALQVRLNRLISNEPKIAERLEVVAIDTIGQRLYRSLVGTAKIASRAEIEAWIAAASAEVGSHKFTIPFLKMEWETIVDPGQLRTWTEYRDVKRLGRKTRLPESQRQTLWKIYERVWQKLQDAGKVTNSGMFTEVAAAVSKKRTATFDFAVIDESQDLGVAHLKFLAAIGGDRENGLFFAGDLGQRIFQQPFSWLSLGVDIRGRARTLHVNYRTTHQIRAKADRLLAREVADIDGNVEKRDNTVSVFNGPKPTVQLCEDSTKEAVVVSEWIGQLSKTGLAPQEFGVFVRSDAEIARARDAVSRSGLPAHVMDQSAATVHGKVSISTMHLAKGLEFRAVVVMACDDEVIPLQERIETVADESDLEEVYNTERHLLYVACTRARDYLLVTGVKPGSEFVGDLA